MSRRFDDDTLSEIRQKPLLGLIRSIGSDVEKWFSFASTPLPETLRLTINQANIDWTRSQLKRMGGNQISWITGFEAWQMPWTRGDAPDDECKKMMQLLHDCGLITRQEAVSMLPPVLLAPKEGELVIDTCAAPGSKATQLAEFSPDSLIIANEPHSGRSNMLVTNRARLGLSNMIITQHDGRHLARISAPGFDAILCDVPCTGSATTRKNRPVWWNWSPKQGRSMFSLQVDITRRAAQLLVPGGRMVYSTCSLDPIENEAVLVEVIRQCPWMELISIDKDKIYPGLVSSPGLNSWEILDELGNAVEIKDELPKLPGLSSSHLDPEGRRRCGDEIDEINLGMTLRVMPEDNDSGGFFVAHLQHRSDATPEGIARSLISRDQRKAGEIHSTPAPDIHTAVPADAEIIDKICQTWGLDADKWTWWSRGKRCSIVSRMAKTRLYQPVSPRSNGGNWQGDSWHPLRATQVGMPCFVESKGVWRIRQEGMVAIRESITSSIVEISLDVLKELLVGSADTDPAIEIGVEWGPLVVSCGEIMLPAWVDSRLTLMVNKNIIELTRLMVEDLK
jgi:16S rRNA C967 or C1407 C5-methylase (RsmB/RsmF family)